MTNLKTILITGGNLGLGYECAKFLAKNHPDYFLVIASRNSQRTEEAVKNIIEYSNNKNVIGMKLDLGSVKSINNFVAEFLNKGLPPLYVLVCNAGLQIVKDTQYTEEGFEATFGVNHLGHFLLTHLLLENIKEPGRIIFVASGTHDPKKKTGMPAPQYTNAHDLAYPKSTNTNIGMLGRVRYTTSKLCNIFTTYQLDNKLKQLNKKITVNAFDPGWMPDTGLSRDYPQILQVLASKMGYVLSFFIKNINTVNTSAKNLSYLITDKSLENTSGKYFEGKEIINSSEESYDEIKANELYQESLKLLKINENILSS